MPPKRKRVSNTINFPKKRKINTTLEHDVHQEEDDQNTSATKKSRKKLVTDKSCEGDQSTSPTKKSRKKVVADKSSEGDQNASPTKKSRKKVVADKSFKDVKKPSPRKKSGKKVVADKSCEGDDSPSPIKKSRKKVVADKSFKDDQSPSPTKKSRKEIVVDKSCKGDQSTSPTRSIRRKDLVAGQSFEDDQSSSPTKKSGKKVVADKSCEGDQSPSPIKKSRKKLVADKSREGDQSPSPISKSRKKVVADKSFKDVKKPSPRKKSGKKVVADKSFEHDQNTSPTKKSRKKVVADKSSEGDQSSSPTRNIRRNNLVAGQSFEDDESPNPTKKSRKKVVADKSFKDVKKPSPRTKSGKKVVADKSFEDDQSPSVTKKSRKKLVANKSCEGDQNTSPTKKSRKKVVADKSCERDQSSSPTKKSRKKVVADKSSEGDHSTSPTRNIRRNNLVAGQSFEDDESPNPTKKSKKKVVADKSFKDVKKPSPRKKSGMKVVAEKSCEGDDSPSPIKKSGKKVVADKSFEEDQSPSPRKISRREIVADKSFKGDQSTSPTRNIRRKNLVAGQSFEDCNSIAVDGDVHPKSVRQKLNGSSSKKVVNKHQKDATAIDDSPPNAQPITSTSKQIDYNGKTSDHFEESSNIPKSASLLEVILYKLQTQYSNVVENLKLDFVPVCFIDPIKCKIYHSRKSPKIGLEKYNNMTNVCVCSGDLSNLTEFFNTVQNFCCANIFPGEECLFKLIEIILSYDERSYVREIISQAASAFDLIVETFPPCWHEIHKDYMNLLEKVHIEYPFSKEYIMNETLLFNMLTLIEGTLNSEEAKSESDSSECSIDIGNFSYPRKIANYYFDTFQRNSKIERLFLILQSLTKIMEADLAVWMIRNPNLNQINSLPIICEVLWKTAKKAVINETTRLAVKLFNKSICVQMDEFIIDILSRLLNLISHAFHISGHTTWSKTETWYFPKMLLRGNPLVQQIFGMLKVKRGYPIKNVLKVVLNLKTPYVKLLLIDEWLQKIQNNELDNSVKRVFQLIMQHKVKNSIINDVEMPSLSDSPKYRSFYKMKMDDDNSIEQLEFLTLLLHYLKAYVDIFRLFDIVTEMQNKGVNLESPINNWFMPQYKYVPNRGVTIESEQKIQYREDVKHLSLLTTILIANHNEHGDDFNDFLNFILKFKLNI